VCYKYNTNVMEEKEKTNYKSFHFKVGQNTYPNMLVMLSGHSIDTRFTASEDFSPRWRIKGDGYFDALPMVWKNFSNNGYMTLYAEDEPQIQAFNFVYKGFKKQPTDYYSRPFWIAMNENILKLNNNSKCYAHVPKHHHLFNYTRDFLLMMSKEKQPYFALTISSCLSHGYIYEMKVIYFSKDFQILFYKKKIYILGR